MAYNLQLILPKGNCITWCTFFYYTAQANEVSLLD